MKLTTRWYYTFKEVLEIFNEEENLGWRFFDNGILDDEDNGVDLHDILKTLGHYLNIVWTDTKSTKMFDNYLWPEYQDAVILYLDTLVDPWELGEDQPEPDFDDLKEEFELLNKRMWRWLKESIERYGVLIDAYEQIENNLLARVATVTEAQGTVLQANDTSSTSSGSSSGAAESINRESGSVSVQGSENNSGTTSNSEESIQTHNNTKVHLENDTPQSTWSDGFSTDPYVSRMSQDTESGRSVNGSQSSGSVSNSATSNSSTESVNNGSNSTSNESTTTNTISTSAEARGSNSQSSVVGSDVTTPIERLDEIRKKLHNLYADWADEFSRFVIYAD